jgi:hypothetical protein
MVNEVSYLKEENKMKEKIDKEEIHHIQ